MTATRRVVTGSVLIAVLGSVIVYGGPLAFSTCVLAFTGVALFEFFTLLREAKMPCYRLFGVAMGVVIPVVVYLEQGGTLSGEVLFLILGCLFLFILQFSRKNQSDALVGISLTLFGILYISWFLSFLIKLRFLDEGARWAGYLLATTKAGDIGAYAVGSIFGKHPLIPHISPKKSVEGMVGGWATSIAVSLALGSLLPIAWTPTHLVILGFFIALVGQMGDLSESVMKRFCQSKDSGAILPGMGGVMDAVDSVLFTAPLFYFHLRTFI